MVIGGYVKEVSRPLQKIATNVNDEKFSFTYLLYQVMLDTP